jgi:hypothetical protein
MVHTFELHDLVVATWSEFWYGGDIHSESKVDFRDGVDGEGDLPILKYFRFFEHFLESLFLIRIQLVVQLHHRLHLFEDFFLLLLRLLEFFLGHLDD